MLEYSIESEVIAKGYTNVCGVDEAGRGPLCGPVCAAAVILPVDCEIEGINDSKKLSEKKREAFEEYYLSDLSLAEIAEGTGTSRQAVRDLISRASAELVSFEEKLSLLQKRKEIQSLCDALSKNGESSEPIIEKIREIL